jgi:hypothetical protein
LRVHDLCGGDDNTGRFWNGPRSRQFINPHKIAAGLPVNLNIIAGRCGGIYKVNRPNRVSILPALPARNVKPRIAVGISCSIKHQPDISGMLGGICIGELDGEGQAVGCRVGERDLRSILDGDAVASASGIDGDSGTRCARRACLICRVIE